MEQNIFEMVQLEHIIGISSKPEELEKDLNDKKFKTIDIKGLKFNPITKVENPMIFQ